MFSWARNFPDARPKVTHGIGDVYGRADGFPLLFIERVIRLPWSALRERRNINTVRTPAKTRNAAPRASAFGVFRPDLSGAGTVAFVGMATAGATRLTGGAAGPFVGFTVATSGGKFVSTLVMALVGNAAIVGGG